jgi:hypothetical protein
MSEDYWDNSPEEERYEAEEDSVVSTNPFVFVNGAKIDIDVGSSFAETISGLAREAGLGKFRVVLNGEDTLPSEAPDFISEGDKIELLKYDIAG